MIIAKQLLDLTLEYHDAVEKSEWKIFGTPDGRTPDEIAAEYATTLRKFLATS